MSKQTKLDEDYELAWRSDPLTVIMKSIGMTDRQMLVELVKERHRILDEIKRLQVIAPFKVTAPDGSVMIWRCPDHMVP